MSSVKVAIRRDIKKAELLAAFEQAIEELWELEMVDTGMNRLDVGPKGTYADKQDWAESKFSQLVKP